MLIYRITKVNFMDLDEPLLFSTVDKAKAEVERALTDNEVDTSNLTWTQHPQQGDGTNPCAEPWWLLQGPDKDEDANSQIDALLID